MVKGFLEFGRWVNALRHTAKFADHAANSDHHSGVGLLMEARETYAGLRRFDRKRHTTRWRNPVGMFFWGRRESHHYQNRKGRR